MNSSHVRSLSSSVIKPISWEYYISLIHELKNRIDLKNPHIDFIYGVPRGGLIPAVILSHEMGLPIISNFMDGKDGVVLIVDDLVDTGKTVINLIAMRDQMDVVIATLYKHKKCRVFPDFYVEENDCWIEFPYEKN